MGNGSSRPSISVVIPALNEEAGIKSAIVSAQQCPNCEVIVVDGGSGDNTVSIARQSGARVVHSPKGRAKQLNAGAACAQSDVLVFLHADTKLPAHWNEYVHNALNTHSENTLKNRAPNTNRNTKGSSWGCFETIDINAPPFTSWAIHHTVSLRTKIFHKPYGDQALFMYKDAFNQAGRYPSDWQLLEDLALVTSLNKNFGAPYIVPKAIETSGRRWKELGLIKTTLINQYVLLGHALGVDTNTLSGIYYNAAVQNKK